MKLSCQIRERKKDEGLLLALLRRIYFFVSFFSGKMKTEKAKKVSNILRRLRLFENFEIYETVQGQAKGGGAGFL